MRTPTHDLNVISLHPYNATDFSRGGTYLCDYKNLKLEMSTMKRGGLQSRKLSFSEKNLSPLESTLDFKRVSVENKTRYCTANWTLARKWGIFIKNLCTKIIHCSENHRFNKNTFQTSSVFILTSWCSWWAGKHGLKAFPSTSASAEMHRGSCRESFMGFLPKCFSTDVFSFTTKQRVTAC